MSSSFSTRARSLSLVVREGREKAEGLGSEGREGGAARCAPTRVTAPAGMPAFQEGQKQNGRPEFKRVSLFCCLVTYRETAPTRLHLTVTATILHVAVQN